MLRITDKISQGSKRTASHHIKLAQGGLRGLVFKSHGSSDKLAFEVALNRAYDAARHRLLDRVHDQIAATLVSLPSSAEPASEADVGRAA